MNTVGFITRHKSYKDMLEHLGKRHKEILEILGNKEMTTREVAIEMQKKHKDELIDLNTARPRMTELEQMGILVADKMKKCEYTGKMVAVYRKANEIEKMQINNDNHIPHID